MTPKQIETLKINAEIAVNNSIECNQPSYISDYLDQMDQLFKIMFDLFLIKDWSKADKIKKEIIDYMLTYYNKRRKTA